MSTFAKLNTFYRRDDAPVLALGTFAIIISAIPSAALTILMGRVFNDLQNFISGKTPADTFLGKVLVNSGSIMALGLGSFLITWAAVACWVGYGETISARGRAHIYNTLTKKSLSWFDKTKDSLGLYVSLERGVEELRIGVADALPSVIQGIAGAGFLLGISMYYDWSLTLIILATAPLMVAVTVVCGNLIERFAARENSVNVDAGRLLDWTFSSVRLVKASAGESWNINEFKTLIYQSSHWFNKLAATLAAQQSLLRFLCLMMFVEGFWYGSKQVSDGKATSGDVMTAFWSCVMAAQQFGTLAPNFVVINRAVVAVDSIKAFSDNIYKETDSPIKKEPSKDDGSSVTVENPFADPKTSELELSPERKFTVFLHWPEYSQEIAFHNVSFSYPARPDTRVLHDLTVSFPSGEMNFLVGASGSGKSTLGSLLLNLYTPESGMITIGGVPVESISPRDLTTHICCVQQDLPLFHDTLRNNLVLPEGSTEDLSLDAFTDQDLLNALQFAGLETLVSELPDGLNTLLGPKGSSVSGGQRQRIALARAFLRDPEILILDEVFSGLQKRLQGQLISRVRDWRKGKTTILVMHDYGAIAPSEEIIVMRTGRVVARGTKESLESTGSLQMSESLESHNNRYSSTVDTEKTEESSFSTDTDTTIEEGKQQAGSESSEPQLPPEASLKYLFASLYTFGRTKTLLLGTVSAVAHGIANPCFSYTFSKLLSGLMNPQSSNPMKWSFIVIGVALGDTISHFLKLWCLNRGAEVWVRRLRQATLAKLLVQSLSYLSQPKTAPHRLQALLLSDIRDLRTVSAELLAAVLSTVALLLLGLIWAFVMSWSLALIGLAFVPVFLIASQVSVLLMTKHETWHRSLVSSVEQVAHESLQTARTVKLLGAERYFEARFLATQHTVIEGRVRRGLLMGGVVAAGGVISFVAVGTLLYYTMKLVGNDIHLMAGVFAGFVLLVFTMVSASECMGQISDVGKGIRTGGAVLSLLSDNGEAELSLDVYNSSDSQGQGKGKENNKYSLAQRVISRFNGSETKNEKDSSVELTENININSSSQQRKRDIAMKNKGFSSSTVPVSPDDISHESLIFSDYGTPLKLALHDLHFSYHSEDSAAQTTKPQTDSSVLRSLNMELLPGAVNCIVGPSGSGKSTILSLLLKFYNPSQGSITVNGTDLQSLDTRKWRESCSIVTQSPVFFPGSIFQNIVYGMESPASQEQIEEALELVGLAPFVASLPEGLHTMLGTTGESLLVSGGQAQRLQLVRSLVRQPRLLLLDEFTSALDPIAAESLVKLLTDGTMRQMCPNVTVLVVTHDPRVMKSADRLFVMAKGSVSQQGTYTELLGQRGGVLRQLVCQGSE